MSLKNTLYSCGLIYEIVSNIPKVGLEVLLVYGMSTCWSSLCCLCFPGLGGAGGEGNPGPHGSSRGQRRDPGWRDVHREIHPRSSGGGEHPKPGEAATGENAQTLWNTNSPFHSAKRVQALHESFYTFTAAFSYWKAERLFLLFRHD